MNEMFGNSVNEELVSLESLKQHSGWLVFKKIIKWRQSILVKSILTHMRQGQIDEAQNARSGYDELNKILAVVSDRINALKTEIKKEEG